jgi:hypothetical protein
MNKELKKWSKTLQKLRHTPADKQTPGELKEAKEHVEEYSTIVKKHHNKLVQDTHLFTISKIETFKNCLTSLLERNLKFHEQANNIIENSEMLVKDIKVEEEYKNKINQTSNSDTSKNFKEKSVSEKKQNQT